MNTTSFSHYGKELKQRVIDNELAVKEELKGCPKKFVESLAAYSSVGFIPEVYRQFLLKFGEEAGGFMNQYYFSSKYLDQIQTEGRTLVKKTNHEVPNDAFFFATFDFVDFFYFSTTERNDNPPVYFFSRARKPTKLYESLTEFFDAEIDGE